MFSQDDASFIPVQLRPEGLNGTIAWEWMDRANSRTRNIAQWLLAHEAGRHGPAGVGTPAFVHVSERLRHRLSTLTGSTGFRSLLARAVTLAKAESSILAAVQVKPDGALDGLDALHGTDVEQAGAVLIAQFLGLLSVFIGETLTIRLLQDAWPDLPVIDANSMGSQNDAAR